MDHQAADEKMKAFMQSPLGSSVCVQTHKDETYFYAIKLPCSQDEQFSAIFFKSLGNAQTTDGLYLPDQHDTLQMLGYVNNETGKYVAAPTACVTLNHFFGDTFPQKPLTVSQLREDIRLTVRDRLRSMPDEEIVKRIKDLTGEDYVPEQMNQYHEDCIRKDSQRAYAMNREKPPTIFHPSAIDIDSRVFWPGNNRSNREVALAGLSDWDKFLDQILNECLIKDGAGILTHRKLYQFAQEQMDAAKDDPALQKERTIREAVDRLKSWSAKYMNSAPSVPVTFGREDYTTLSEIKMPLSALNKYKGTIDLTALAQYARSEILDFLFKDANISPYLLDPPIASIVEIGDYYDPIYRDEDFFARKEEHELATGRVRILSIDDRLKEAGERARQRQAVPPEKEFAR